MLHYRAGATAALLLLIPCAPFAQSSTQLWSEIRFDWIKSREFSYGVDIEPKVLVSAPSGDPGWASLDVTPSLEYSHGEWFDMVGEMLVGRTLQTDDLDSTEFTPRIGLRLHLLSNLRHEIVKERRPSAGWYCEISCGWSGAICTTPLTSLARRPSGFATGSRPSGR